MKVHAFSLIWFTDFFSQIIVEHAYE
jgi:hypothetical protein